MFKGSIEPSNIPRDNLYKETSWPVTTKLHDINFHLQTLYVIRDFPRFLLCYHTAFTRNQPNALLPLFRDLIIFNVKRDRHCPLPLHLNPCLFPANLLCANLKLASTSEGLLAIPHCLRKENYLPRASPL